MAWNFVRSPRENLSLAFLHASQNEHLHAGEMVALGWSGNAFCRWWKWLGRGASGPAEASGPVEAAGSEPEKWQEDGGNSNEVYCLYIVPGSPSKVFAELVLYQR